MAVHRVFTVVSEFEQQQKAWPTQRFVLAHQIFFVPEQRKICPRVRVRYGDRFLANTARVLTRLWINGVSALPFVTNRLPHLDPATVLFYVADADVPDRLLAVRTHVGFDLNGLERTGRNRLPEQPGNLFARDLRIRRAMFLFPGRKR